MNLGRAGIWSLELRMADPGQISEQAAELDELGWGTLWIPGLGGGDIVGDSERLLRATGTANVATGVASIWKHDAAEMATGHHRLTAAYGPRVLLGLGVSDPGSAHRAGRPFRPVADMNDYLDRLDHGQAPVPAGERILAALGRVRTEAAVRPHRVRGWLNRADDQAFWAQAGAACRLYLDPPPGTVLVSIDEKTGYLGQGAPL
ncbi:LLM class F420-dependent oxidoreductase, partial [Frankia sp. Cppng1_Ct_nod]|uniref:LLM class F420-dependent oxidoreductase n=1 Tax=Frankia sp. Cppng1_Ct_nod TaxID=2897162 RepID=UPI0032EA250C